MKNVKLNIIIYIFNLIMVAIGGVNKLIHIKGDGIGNLIIETLLPNCFVEFSNNEVKIDNNLIVDGNIVNNDLNNKLDIISNKQDVSFTNLDISGILKLNNIDISILLDDISNAIITLISGAPEALDTLNELANALDNSANFASVITNKLSNIDTSFTEYTKTSGLYTNTQIDNSFVLKSVFDASLSNYYIKEEIDNFNFISSNSVTSLNTLTLSGPLNGPATFVIDPAGVGDNTGMVIIRGGLQVDGSSTIINSSIVDISDHTILLASNAPNQAATNGAGIEISGNKYFKYKYPENKWETNIDISANISGNLTGNVTGNAATSTKIASISNENIILINSDASLNNLDISGNLKISNGNIDISHGIINFFATDEQLLGPDTGIAQKVQDLSNSVGDLSNNLLTANNDASLNNVDICGNLNITELILNNNTILEKRITSGSIFRCANFYEDFNSTIRFAYLVRTNGNNNYAMIHVNTNHRIFDRYTKKNFTIGGNSTTSNYAEAQFDYWHQPVTQYGITNSTTLVFDECIFGDYTYDNRGSITIYRRDESNFDWTYQNSLQNYNSHAGNFTYQGNKLHLSPDGSRLFWTSKTSKYIYMLYRGQRNRSYLDVMNEYYTFFLNHAGNPDWNDYNRISNSIENEFTDVHRTGVSNNEFVHYEFDSNTDGTILTAMSTSNSNASDTKIYILYSPTLKSSPEGIFNMQNGNTNNFSDISGDIPDGTTLASKGLHNDYFIFQTIVFNDSTDGIFDISYGYPSGQTNPNIDSIGGPIGRIINTNTTVYLDVIGKISNELLLYSKQIMSNDGLTLVVNDSGYNNNNGCIIILERPTIDVSFTYSTFFQGGDFQTPPTGVRFGQALAITQSDQIYAGSVNTGIMGHNFIINKIGNQWVETLLELPRNSQSNQDSDGEGFGSYGGVVNMSSDGNSLVGGYSVASAYVGVEYYLKESNENFITSYGAIHNSLRADYIYNNFGAQLTSDDRYKIQEKIINNGLQTIRLLNPKKYLKTTLEYKADYSGNIQPNDSVFEESGLIAQELLDISNLNYVVSNTDNKYNVRYNDIFIHGLAATKELDILVSDLKNENTLLKNALNTLLSEAGKPTI